MFLFIYQGHYNAWETREMRTKILVGNVEGFVPVSSHVGVVVDKFLLQQISFEYLPFPCKFVIPTTAPFSLNMLSS
jgi:hypothetical protein